MHLEKERVMTSQSTSRSSRAIAGVFIVVVAMVMAACGSSSKSTNSANNKTVAPQSGGKGVTELVGTTDLHYEAYKADPNATKGGTLTVYKPSEVPGLDPVVISNSGSFDAPPAFMIYDPLMYSENGSIKLQSAESMTTTDAVVWTLKLHPNMKFSDGTPWDAAAVKFNWERIADPANKSPRQGLASQIQTMDVVDPVTLKVTLKAKNALFPGSVTLMPFIGSPTAIQQMGKDKFNNNPVGGGPFIVESWQRDSQMVLRRNPNYWNAPLPYLDKVVLKPITDETQRLNTFCGNTADGLIFIQSVQDADRMQKQNCGKIEPFVLNGGLNMFYNLTKPPMNNLALRQGIAMAINFDEYSKVVDLGLVPPTHSVFRPDSPFYDPNILQPAYNPTKAQQLFDQAAKELGTDTIDIPIATFPSPNYQASAQFIQAALNRYKHLNLTFSTVATAQHVTECQQKQYVGICHYGNPFDDPDPTWVVNFLCTSTVNPTGYCNQDFDKLIEDSRTTLDPEQRVKDLKDAQKIFYHDQPALYVETRYSWAFTDPNLQEFRYVNDGALLFDRLWLKPR
jgi:peptide/nickel transport system substrate-binding protein